MTVSPSDSFRIIRGTRAKSKGEAQKYDAVLAALLRLVSGDTRTRDLFELWGRAYRLDAARSK